MDPHLKASPQSIPAQEAAATIAQGIGALARTVDELQPFMGRLLQRAGVIDDPAMLRSAQTVDAVAQQLHRYAALVAALGACLPEQGRFEPADDLSALDWLTAASRPPAIEAGECEFL